MDRAARRLRTYRLNSREIMDVFFRRKKAPPMCVAIPSFEPIPEGANLIGVETCHAPLYFDFLVEHDSFDPVPWGQSPPVFPGFEAVTTVYQIKSPEECSALFAKVQ